MPEPFLKWPGGKRWLVDHVKKRTPPGIKRYFEPFVGSGAVFFHLQPQSAYLADTNSELINAYACVRDNAAAIERALEELHRHHCEEQYYQWRAAEPRSPLKRAVRFIYLNRTCFNGIYRENRHGRFNVPMGSKKEVRFASGFLAEVGKALECATLRTADFEETMSRARAGDLVFVDPPYSVMHNDNGFVKYNARLFSWADQTRLAVAVRRTAERGASIVVSNADHDSVRELYRDFGVHEVVERSTVLSANPRHRRLTTELVITHCP